MAQSTEAVAAVMPDSGVEGNAVRKRARLDVDANTLPPSSMTVASAAPTSLAGAPPMPLRLAAASYAPHVFRCHDLEPPAPSDDLNAKWRAWLADAPDLGVSKHRSYLDELLRPFVLGHETTTQLPPLEGVHRLCVHRRCEQLGLTSVSHGRHYGEKEMTITKPPGWSMPWHGARELSPAPPRPVKLTRGQRRTARRDAYWERMEDWRAPCNNCGEELDIFEALYHHNRMGPYCQDCVDSDMELSGRTWEAKADMWPVYSDNLLRRLHLD